MNELVAWLFAFACTQAIEVPLYLRVTGSWRAAFGASALTHPVVWFAFPLLCERGASYWAMVAAAEVFAIGAEALWLRRAGVHRALGWSALVNGASAIAGLLLRDVFGAP